MTAVSRNKPVFHTPPLHLPSKKKTAKTYPSMPCLQFLCLETLFPKLERITSKRNTYIVLSELGNGDYGSVCRVVSQNLCLYASKSSKKENLIPVQSQEARYVVS